MIVAELKKIELIRQSDRDTTKSCNQKNYIKFLEINDGVPVSGRRIILLDFTICLIYYYTRKKVTYEYNKLRR